MHHRYFPLDCTALFSFYILFHFKGTNLLGCGKKKNVFIVHWIFFIKKQNLKINLVLSLGCIYFSIIRFFLFNLYLHISNSSVSYFTCGSDSKLLALFLLLIVFCMLIRWFHWLAFTFGLASYFFWHLPQTAYFYRRKWYLVICKLILLSLSLSSIELAYLLLKLYMFMVEKI